MAKNVKSFKRMAAAIVFVSLQLIITGSTMVEARYFGDYYQSQQQAQQPSDESPQAAMQFENIAEAPIIDSIEQSMPPQSSVVMMPTFVREVENEEWTQNARKTLSSLGDITGVAASFDFLYVFHRGNRTWNENSFDEETNQFTNRDEPIAADTVVAVDQATGEIMFSWGSKRFFMPHGISVDPQGNVWLTDVALHQAFRYKKNSFDSPDLVLGERFTPGDDAQHFCKPTDVAIASTGVIYISDGYCNSRVVIFSAAGQYLTEIGREDKMIVPHSVSLLEIDDLLCVADRENERILCYNAGLTEYLRAGELLFEIRHAELHKLYAIAHIGGENILALNGGPEPTVGVTFDLATEQLVSTWAPSSSSNESVFRSAHDLTVSHDGRSFFVSQFGDPLRRSSSCKVIKFDVLESLPPPQPIYGLDSK